MTSRAWARGAAATGALLLPLVLVNSAAVYGQTGWAHDHLIANWWLAAGFAAAVESIGIYLAFEAHAALMAGDASARLRAGSYLIGALAGALNYAHFAGQAYRPTPLAVTFAALSSISPWLWAIRSRSMNRARLRELGQIDPRAVRFAALRWALFPVRTVRAFRVAVWHGIVTPAEAVARSGVSAPGLPAEVAPEVADDAPEVWPADALTLAELTTPREVADQVALPAALPQAIAAAPAAAEVAPAAASEASPAPSKSTALPLTDRVAELAELVASGRPPKPAEVARIVGTDNIPHVGRTLRKSTREGNGSVTPTGPRPGDQRPTAPPPRPARTKREESSAQHEEQPGAAAVDQRPVGTSPAGEPARRPGGAVGERPRARRPKQPEPDGPGTDGG